MGKSKNDILQGTLTLLVLRRLEARGACHGYALCGHIQSASGDLLRVEEGSLYPALHRMEQEGWLRSSWRVTEKGRKAKFYEITAQGRTELKKWFDSPVRRSDRPRDEVAIKLALAITTPGVDVAKVVMTQRTATMRTLQEYTRLKTQPGDLPWLLVLDAMIFQAEAELRWLDHCEASLLRYEPRAVPETTDVEVPR